MTSVPSPQILLTGATGYIGGTVLTQLLNSSSPAFQNVTVIPLVRGSDRADKLSSTYGDRVRPIVYKDIDDLEATTAAAAEADIIINAGAGYHLPSAQALLKGLAQRKSSTGRDTWFVHTSGASNLSDQPISRTWTHKEGVIREFDDAKDDVYGFEKEREALHPYIQRTTELGLIDEALELGVKTVVLMPPTIFGIGSGLFNKVSIQIPTYIKTVLKHGHAVVVSDGKGQWDHVHVEDLADLYTIIIQDIIENNGENLPTGKKGIIFTGNGRNSWMELAQGVADACYEEGQLSDNKVERVSLSEGTKILGSYWEGGAEAMIELGFASNSWTVASVAKILGWTPSRGEDAWQKGFRNDVKAVSEKRQ